MSENKDVALEATEQATPVDDAELENINVPTPEISDVSTAIVDSEDSRITYQGEDAQKIDFTPDANAVAITVFPNGQIITEY